MKPTIQKWYTITRNIAIAAALVILVYVAIKIFLSTAAGDKAKYKSLLKDWLLSLLLIFTMHFIMAGILFATDAITNTIASIAVKTSGIGGTDVYDWLMNQALAANSDSIIYALIVWVLLGVTLAMIIIYAKRVIMIAFLSVFAPLVALSYSIDKIKDGQSQILDKWMKEYVYTALMMPLDAMLFAILADAMVNNLSSGNFIFGMALAVGYLPLRGWFNEFLGTDKTGHSMTGVVAGAALANALQNNKKDKETNVQSNVTSNSKSNTSVDSGSNSGLGGGGTPSINTKSGANPALTGGADKPRVSSPTSAAAATSNSSLSAGEQAALKRQERKDKGKNALKKVGSVYGKGLGTVAGVGLGLMTTAMTGNVKGGLAAGITATKFANKGNEYGLGGKLTSGTTNLAKGTANAVKGTAIGAKDLAMGIGAKANDFRDKAMVNGMVNALADKGSLADIEDEDERENAFEWAANNMDQDHFAELLEKRKSGELEVDDFRDEVFRSAIKDNKSEVRQAAANKRMATRVDRKSTMDRAEFKELNSADNEAMRAKKKEIKSRGKK